MLDAKIAMIPKTDGDATPPWSKASLRTSDCLSCLGLCSYEFSLDAWFKSWVPDSVFSAGGGRGSVEAWYTTALDI